MARREQRREVRRERCRGEEQVRAKINPLLAAMLTLRTESPTP